MTCVNNVKKISQTNNTPWRQLIEVSGCHMCRFSRVWAVRGGKVRRGAARDGEGRRGAARGGEGAVRSGEGWRAFARDSKRRQ